MLITNGRGMQSTVPPAPAMWPYCMLDALSLPSIPSPHRLFSLVLACRHLHLSPPTAPRPPHFSLVGVTCLFSLVSLTCRRLRLDRLSHFSQSVLSVGTCARVRLFYTFTESAPAVLASAPALARQIVTSHKHCVASKRESTHAELKY